MAIKKIKGANTDTPANYGEWLIDNDSDISSLPTSKDKKDTDDIASIGSLAYSVNSKKTYMLDNNNTWSDATKLFSNGGTGGSSGGTGADGFSPIATVARNATGATITITDKNGTTTADVNDGFTPTIKATQNSDGVHLMITNADGSSNYDITNGKDGSVGAKGADGFSPTVKVTQTDTGATISITDVNGTTSADLASGVIGRDGVSPTANVTQTDTGATISITDAKGTTTADIKNGAKGDDGASPAISVYANTTTNYQLKITNTDGTEIITPNLKGKDSGSTPATEMSVIYNSSDSAKYLNTIYVYNAYRASQSLATPESLQSTIDNKEKIVNADNAIDINQNDFGWANLGLIINTTPVAVSSSEMILTTANVNGTATEKIYFIPKSLITATTANDIAKSISTLLTADTIDKSILTMDNSLIHTNGSPLTVAVKLSGVTDGDYYIALSAHSDNSKPIFYNIWIQE